MKEPRLAEMFLAIFLCFIVVTTESAAVQSLLSADLSPSLYYSIRSAQSNRFLRTTTSQAANGELMLSYFYTNYVQQITLFRISTSVAGHHKLESYYSVKNSKNTVVGVSSTGSGQPLKSITYSATNSRVHWLIVDNGDGTVSFRAQYNTNYFIHEANDTSKNSNYGKATVYAGNDAKAKFVIEAVCRNFAVYYLKFPNKQMLDVNFTTEMTPNNHSTLGTVLQLSCSEGYIPMENATNWYCVCAADPQGIPNWNNTDVSSMCQLKTPIETCEEADAMAQSIVASNASYSIKVDDWCVVYPSYAPYMWGIMSTASAASYCTTTYKQGQPVTLESRRKMEAIRLLLYKFHKQMLIETWRRPSITANLLQTLGNLPNNTTQNHSLAGWFWRKGTEDIAISEQTMSSIWHWMHGYSSWAAATFQRFHMVPVQSRPNNAGVSSSTAWSQATPMCQFPIRSEQKGRIAELVVDQERDCEFTLGGVQLGSSCFYKSYYWIGLNNMVGTGVSYWVDDIDDVMMEGYSTGDKPTYAGLNTTAAEPGAIILNTRVTDVYWTWKIKKNVAAAQPAICILERKVPGQRYRTFEGLRYLVAGTSPYSAPVQDGNDGHTCAIHCNHVKACVGFNIDKGNGKCELLHMNADFKGETGSLTEQANWVYHERIDDPAYE